MTTSQDISYLCGVLNISWSQDGRRKEVTEEEMHSRTGNSMFEGRLFWGKGTATFKGRLFQGNGTVCEKGRSSEMAQALENMQSAGEVELIVRKWLSYFTKRSPNRAR